MYKRVAILTLFLSVFLFQDLLGQSAVCNYKYRKRITFNPAQVMTAADIPNYTALIKINSDNDLRHTTSSGHVENNQGFDIIFTLDDGVTKLDHVMEKYTPGTGEFIAWVRLPNLSTTLNTNIYMYYGNTAIAANQSVTTTWNSVYRNAYFFSVDYDDKSQGGNNGTNSNFALAGASGTIANYIASNSVNDYVAIGTNGWSANAGTYETWVSSSAWNAVEGYFLGHTSTTTAAPAYSNRIQIYSYNGRLRVGLGGAHSIPNNTDLATFAINRWYHVAVVYSSGNHTVYVNGASVYAGTYTGLSLINSTADVANDGNPAAHNECMAAGNVDNMFIQNVARDAQWIATTYNNQSSPSTFYSISAEPKVWTGGASTTNYNAAPNWLNTSAPSSGDDIIINSAAFQPVLVSDEQIGSLWIKTGATMGCGTRSLSIRYDVTNCGTLSNNTGTVVCNSTSAFAQIQHFSGSGTYNLKALYINNTHATSPSMSLSAPATINTTLHLTNGILYTTSTNLLSLTNAAGSNGGSAASFVSGPMRKTGATDYIFPVGKGTKWRRCAVTNISVSDSYTAEYFNTPFSSTSPVTSPLNHVSYIEYWQVDRAGAGDAKLTLYWEDASISGITNCSDLTIARWNGTTWQERAGTTSGSCAGTGVGSIITNAQLTAFSPFTFASHLSWAVNPLPVSLLKFTATAIKNKKVLIDWSTASENNNDHFEIERSADGVHFELVGTEAGKGNPNKGEEYSIYDNKPYRGVSFYRLKQIDINGKEALTPLETVNITEGELTYNLYPNPNNGEFTIEGDVEGAEIIIYNALGQKVEHTLRSQSPGSMQLDCSTFAKGIYFINIKLGSDTKMHKLVIE